MNSGWQTAFKDILLTIWSKKSLFKIFFVRRPECCSWGFKSLTCQVRGPDPPHVTPWLWLRASWKTEKPVGSVTQSLQSGKEPYTNVWFCIFLHIYLIKKICYMMSYIKYLIQCFLVSFRFPRWLKVLLVLTKWTVPRGPLWWGETAVAFVLYVVSCQPQ